MVKLIQYYSQFFLIAAAFGGMLYFLWRARFNIWEEFKNLPSGYRVGLILLSVIPFICYCSFISPKHVMDDEAFYQFAARNVVYFGHLGDLSKSGGWAFLIFLGYAVAGINNYVSLLISQMFGSLAILGIFFLTLWAGLSRITALTAAVLFTFIPVRMFWAATGESHTASVCFVIWAVAFTFLLYRDLDRNIFWLVFAVWTFAALVRIETLAVFFFFLLLLFVFVPVKKIRGLPLVSALLGMFIVLIPSMISGAKFSLGNQWVPSGSNISIDNFVQNAGTYGWMFLNGGIHPLSFSLAFLFGLLMLYLMDKKIALALGGWFVLVAVMYFSIWFHNYGTAPGIFLKTRLFIFFYPPLVVCAACGIVWLSEKILPHREILVSLILCLMITVQMAGYYRNYPLNSHDFDLQMRVVDDVIDAMGPGNMLVSCLPEVFTGVAPRRISSSGIQWFLQEPEWRSMAFGKVNTVYLVDDIVGQRNCRDTVAEIKEKGHAVLRKEWVMDDTKYAMYSLSRF